MINNILRFYLALIVGFSPLYSQADWLAFTGATIIDATGRPAIDNGVLLIKDQRIAAVGAAGSVSIPKSARVLDVSGKYVIPGLMDANTHLVIPTDVAAFREFEGRYEQLITEAAQIHLKNGITTVFDSWGPRDPLKRIRDRIARGAEQGSRIFLAGNIVGYDGPISPDFYNREVSDEDWNLVTRTNAIWEAGVGSELRYMTRENLRQRIREYTASGIDFFKYGVTGHGLIPHSFLVFSTPMQKIIIDEVRSAGLLVQTHTTTPESLRLALEGGVDFMQHCAATGATPMPEDLLQTIVERQIPCTFWFIFTQQTKSHLEETRKSPKGRQYATAMDTIEQNHRRLIKAGAKVLMNTDGALEWLESPDQEPSPFDAIRGEMIFTPGIGHINWLREMAALVMSPMKLLQTATKNVAEGYRVDDKYGTLEVGKVADLVILNANPLADVENYKDIHLVMKAGAVVDRQSLPAKRILTKPGIYPAWN